MTNRFVSFLLLFFFSIPALSPLSTVTPTQSADGLLHLYRLIQLEILWREGILFARWLPDLAYGYGMPLFALYAPLAYYITVPLHALAIPFSLALNLSLAAAMFLGAAGMFYLTRALLQNIELENAGSLDFAALCSAVAFLYSPYILFNALQRGNLAEQWALAFAPFALWRLFVLAHKSNVWTWTLAILSFVAVMLAHNVTSFLFAPLLFLFTLACILTCTKSGVGDRPPRTNHVSRFTILDSHSSLLIPFSALFLSLSLSAFFWLPALLERDFVQIARVIVTPDFDYRFQFVSPLELVALLPRADTGQMNPDYPATLGVIQTFLALVGILFLVARLRSRRALPFFALSISALAFIGLMLALSQPIWDNLSLLSFVQLPMRLRGLVALCLAPYVGLFAFALPRWRTVTACIAIIGIVLTALPMLDPRSERDVPLNPTLSDMYAFEQHTGTFGTTSFGEYIPVWVQNIPDKSPFDDAYARHEIPDRFVIPEGVAKCANERHALSQTLCASSNGSWHAIYQAFYFPGWVVRVNGSVVPIAPTPRTGLIGFDVPASANISVAYEGTNIEHIADWMSIASAVIVFGILGFSILKQSAAFNLRPLGLRLGAKSSPLNLQQILVLLFLSLALIAFKTLYVDCVSNPFVAHFDGTHIEGISQPREVKFGDELEMLGFDVSAHTIRRGDTLVTRLYWRALPSLRRDLSAFVHLTTTDGTVVAQKDNLHPANLPTTRWDLDAYVADEHAFPIPRALAPGEYELRAGVYDPRANARLQTSGGTDFVLLEKIVVK